ncbi:MAG: aminopeptidase P family protein [Chloroflexi bacterium]|nr:aminopeptidase P family protein [Chloroflexota bacterium]
MPRMASKLTFGNSIADWQERINVARMREQRAARARQIMRKHGVPALLAGTNDNIRYLTGLRGLAFAPQLRYVLFFAEHEPVVFEHAGWFQQMPDQAPWIKNWRIARSWLGGSPGPEATKEESDLFAAEIYEELKQRGLTGEKLGVVGVDNVGVGALERAKLHCSNAHALMQETRSIKNQDEINCLKMVAAIVESAWYKIWAALRPGVRDTDLNRQVSDALIEGGADDLRAPSWLSGPLTFERGTASTGRIIQTGDLVYPALCGISYLGYASCNYRTFIVGRKPNDKEKDWYKRLLDRIDAIIDAIKPGATTADAAKHFPPASSWGYKDEVEVLSVEIGHGLGIVGSYDLPVIARQWSLKHPQVFETGMTLAVESLEGEHRVGGVRLENMVVVTENGGEIMDHMVRDRILEAPL